VLIQSFSPESLQKIHSLRPSLPLIQLYFAGSSKTVRTDLDEAKAYAVGIGPDKFQRIAEGAMGTPWVPRNPRPIPSPAEVMEILTLAA